MIQETKAVLFDLDGTLVDSMWIWKAIDEEYLEKMGHTLPDDLQKAIEGMSFTETATYFKERFNLTEEIHEIKAEWNRMAMAFYTSRVPMKAGVQELLEGLKARGIQMAIGTSNSPELAQAVVQSQGIAPYMEAVLTSCMVERGKPHPDVYLKAAEVLGVSPEDCIVFEDTHAGVLAGKRAGMKVVAVHDDLSADFRTEIEQDADRFVDSVEELVAEWFE